MNIEEAKEEIRRAVRIYLMKDSMGNYRIPVVRQRPVFMTGAPGIGKTAVMEQLAQELDLALVAYSMTHHTRQSALGLPFIVHRTFGGEEYDVSEYTMSEILATVYQTMEKSGRREGILFLDEINCVSETLAPSMLQFLQYKTFGNHRLPDGWVIVTAGNPPAFNRSVREFDIVTLDRLKVLEVEADYGIWKRYAAEKGLHRAVRTYLEIRKEDFYLVEQDARGRRYVTARGWEDLSEALIMYEELGYPVTERLISQYIRHPRVAGEFATYFDLYAKYRGDYRIDGILLGETDEEILTRAKNAPFDERLTVTELLIGALLPDLSAAAEKEQQLKDLLPKLRAIRDDLGTGTCSGGAAGALRAIAEASEEELRALREARGVTLREQRRLMYPSVFADSVIREIRVSSADSAESQFRILKESFEKEAGDLQSSCRQLAEKLEHAFAFIETAFGDGNEMLVAVSEMTMNPDAALFISEYGCDTYFRYQKRFMLHERSAELLEMVQNFRKGEA